MTFMGPSISIGNALDLCRGAQSENDYGFLSPKKEESETEEDESEEEAPKTTKTTPLQVAAPHSCCTAK